MDGWEREIEQSGSVRSRIRIGQGITQESLTGIEAPVFVLADRQVGELTDRILSFLPGSARITRTDLAVPEAEKTLATVSRVYEAMGSAAITRDTVVVVVGGGVMTDLGGYAAATYLRGLKWVAVATTLLGQVDAAIGGKVAVNVPWGKNLVGAFHLPGLVVADLDHLVSLPAEEWRAGLGEVIKSALIAGGPLWDALAASPPVLGRVETGWLPIIRATAEVKIDIVNQDLYESGVRFFLNFGHTIGHALEHRYGYGFLKHGEAVGLGTLVALRLSEDRLGLDPAVRREVASWLRGWGLPTAIAGASLEDLRPALIQDKKARSHGLQWVLLERVGRPRVVKDVPWAEVARALEVIRGA
ncbi:MAG: 3-dehydroquinate synthase [Thermaerobacter sp.]|nr:3-dehydroquinate synthase [Thermaerobacter sp.]